MKEYLKQTLLITLYHPVSYLAGGLIAGFPSLILGAIFEADREPIQNILQPILYTLVPLVFLFFFLHRDAHENRRFSPLLVAGSSLPFFTIQLILVYYRQYGMTLVGSVGIVTPILFPNTENNIHYVLVQIGLQMVLYLPTYILATYIGYKRRMRETQQMIEEHENHP